MSSPITLRSAHALTAGRGWTATIGVAGASRHLARLDDAARLLGVDVVALPLEGLEPALAHDRDRTRTRHEVRLDVAFDSDVLTAVPGHLTLEDADRWTALGATLLPSASVLRVTEDLLATSEALRSAGFPVVPRLDIGSVPPLAAWEWSMPLRARPRSRLAPANTPGARGPGSGPPTVHPAGMLEPAFTRDMALLVVGVRSRSGRWCPYPVLSEQSADGGCSLVRAPGVAGPDTARKAQDLVKAVADGLDIVGVAGARLLVGTDEAVIIDELILSDHVALELLHRSCHPSPWENHVRGLLDLPLTAPLQNEVAAAMVTVGCAEGHRFVAPAVLAEVLDVPGVSVDLGAPGDRRRPEVHLVFALAHHADEALRRAQSAAEHLQRR